MAKKYERNSEVNKVHAVVEILKAAGWRDTCDAQWAGIEATLPELRAVLAAELARDAELLGKIKHSIAQARVPGNDWRRELALIEKTIDAAIAAEKGNKNG